MATPKSPRYPTVRYLQAEREHIELLDKLLRESAAQVEQEILDLGAKEGVTATLTRIQLKAQLAAIQQNQKDLWASVEKLVRSGQKDAAAAASRVVSRYEQDLLRLATTAQQMRALADAEAFRAASGVTSAIGRILSSARPLSERVYGAANLANGQVQRLVNKALVQGWDAKRLAYEVKRYIDPSVPGGVSYAAKRLARTEINNAFHATTIDRYKKDGFAESVDWNLSTSHPEGDECDDLADNSPYPIDEVPEKPHPQCFCNITPNLPDPDEFLRNLFAGDYGDGEWVGSATAGARAKASVSIRDQLFSTAPSEMPSVLKQKFPNAVFSGFDNIGGMSSSDLARSMSRLADLTDKYPILRNLGRIEISSSRNPLNAAETERPNHFQRMSPSEVVSRSAIRIFRTMDTDALREGMLNSIKYDWWHASSTIAAADYVMTHEVAHILDAATGAKTRNQVSRLVKEVGDGRSGYGQRNSAEAVAEAFAAAETSPGAASDSDFAIYRYLLNLLAKVAN